MSPGHSTEVPGLAHLLPIWADERLFLPQGEVAGVEPAVGRTSL